MAKRPTVKPDDLANYFAKTAPTQAEPKPGKVSPVSVALSREELERLTAMAAEINVSRHALLLYIIRDYMRRWQAGERPRKRTKTIEELD